jgi:predicted O-methyltransferase YrrM
MLRYDDVLNYVQSLVGQGGDIQTWARRRSDELGDRGVVPIDPTRGRFLELVARMRAPRRVLEVGSGVGYSTLWLLKGMPRNGLLHAIERDPVVAEELSKVLKRARLKRRVEIHIGPALKTLRRLRRPYDMVFIDAAKEEYPQYLSYAMNLTRPGAVILADNMFWSGATFLRGVRKHGTDGILEYTKRIFNDPRVSSLIVPLGDGIAVSLRIR